MVNRNFFKVLLLTLIFFICISCVAASDINETIDQSDVIIVPHGGSIPTDNSQSPVGGINISERINVIPSGHSIPVDNAIRPSGSFDELKYIIDHLQPGDTYNMNKNYKFDPIYDSKFDQGIIINKNGITINGNGHTIDAAGHTILFTIKGDNVIICNLTGINGLDDRSDLFIRLTGKYSPVVWNGNDGKLYNCKFINNTGVNGGVVTLNGNGAKIYDNEFINNTATGAGGAIYVKGSNSYLENDIFHNCKSIIGEPIFYDVKSEKNIMWNCIFDKGSIYYITGDMINIDVSMLQDSYYTYIGRESFNIIPLIFKAIAYNGTAIYINDYLSYYAIYNGTDVVFTINKEYDRSDYKLSWEDSTELTANTFVTKTLHFAGIINNNDLYSKILNHDFKTEYNLIAEYIITGNKCYEYAKEFCYRDPFAFIRSNEWLIDADAVTKTMSITLKYSYANPCVTDTTGWNMAETGYDVLNINGDGLTIKGSGISGNEEKWIRLNENCIFTASNLIIEGYNNAVENLGGNCIFNNITFQNNHVDYMFERDCGAAIINAGTVICNNCSFINNSAKYGGAIFNQGLLILNNVTFQANSAYGKGSDILNADKGIVILDGEEIVGSNGPVEYVESLPLSVVAILTSFSLIVPFIAGLVAGLITVSPLIGSMVGAIAGAACGSVITGLINMNTFDIYIDRLNMALLIIGASITTGILGGILGGCVAKMIPAIVAETAPEAPVIIEGGADITFGAGEVSATGTVPGASIYVGGSGDFSFAGGEII